MPAIFLAESRKAIQYTGSNSAEIDAAITDLTIDSESGGTLTVTSSSTQYVVSTGDWLTFWQGYVNGLYTNTQFEFFFVENAVGSDIDSLTGTIAGIGSAALRSAGVASAPTLLLGIPANVAVTLVPAMPDTSYTPSAYIFGTGVNLGSITINSVTVTSASVVTVNLQTSLVSLPGVHILVTAKS